MRIEDSSESGITDMKRHYLNWANTKHIVTIKTYHLCSRREKLCIYFYFAENHTESITGQIYLLLKSLSLSVCQCPKQQVLDHKLAAYLKADDTSGLPNSLQTLLNHVCPLLSHDVREVQLGAFHLLYR